MNESLEEIKSLVLTLDYKIASRIYLFGSSLNNKSFANDIDILIIYEDEIELREAKNVLYPLQYKYPLDLLFAHSDEEKELELIKAMDAKPLMRT